MEPPIHDGERLNAATNLAAATRAPGSQSAMKRSLILVMHQFFATMGALLLAGLLTGVVLDIPRIWGHVFPVGDVRRVLLMASPFYPIQIVVGLLWGWLIWAQFRHRAMFWVWVFPLFSLVIGLLSIPTYTSEIVPDAALSTYPWFSRFFGYDCRSEGRCLEQLGFTLPFYTAVAYSAGAWWAFRFPARSRLVEKIAFSIITALGVLILGDTIFGVARYSGRQPLWLFILAGAVMGVTGMCLIWFAFRMRRIQEELTPPTQRETD